MKRVELNSWKRELMAKGRQAPERDPPDFTPSETLGQAYVRRHSELRAFLLRRTGSADAADELVQEIWVRIASRAEDRTILNPDGWLQQVAVNLALRWLQRKRFRSSAHVEGAPLPEQQPDEAPAPDRALHARHGVQYLLQLVEEMPPRRRTVFLLYRGRGLSLNETAQQMGLSVLTVKRQMAEAMIFLRERMSEAGLWP
jgi:RNA polymerase sigma factor (sigma-70 family)